MSLKNYYQEAKKPGQGVSLTILILSICIVAIYFYAIWIGWNNVIIKVFNLPSMTYLQTVGIILWGFLIKILCNVGIKK